MTTIDWNHECQTLKKIGEGTFASVYICRRKSTGQKIVMKSIPLSGCSFLLSTVQREYSIFSQVRHSRLIECYGFYQCQKSWNFILEYAPNGTLGHKIETLQGTKNGGMSQNEILDIFTDILVGVKYLHFRSIIHRDLKPDNILFDQYGRAKIVDFGISKIYETLNNSGSEIHEMTKIGTPFYMAPEILNHETYDFKCDVWSLGIIFYEMCELRHPFGEKGTLDCFDLSLPFKVPVIDTKKRRFHPAMNKICEMMIVREPEKRVDLHQIVNHHLIRNKFCTVFFEK